MWPPTGWVPGTYTGPDRRPRTYYRVDRAGPQAPPVLLMHELPGISEHLVEFAEDLAGDFRLVVPSIVGRDGHPGLPSSLLQLCIRREIHAFAAGRTSPAVTWLRGLADEVVAGPTDAAYGVVGMCLTGGFALALAVDPRVPAAVVAQPAGPFSWLGLPLPWAASHAADLGLDPADRERLRQRADLCVRALRFAGDRISPAARLDTLKDLLESRVDVVTLPGRGHSTLTGKTRDMSAVREVKEFLRTRLAA